MSAARTLTLTGIKDFWNTMVPHQRAGALAIERRYAEQYASTHIVAVPSWVPVFQNVIEIGGKGSGKTLGAAYTAAHHALHTPDGMGVIVRKRHEQLRNTFLADFLWMLDRFTRCAEYPEGNRELLVIKEGEKDGAIEVTIRTVVPPFTPYKMIFRIEPEGDERTVADSFKSYNLDFFLLEEASQLLEATYVELLDRLRRPQPWRKGPPIYRGYVLSNPTTKSFWLAKLAARYEQQMLAYNPRLPDDPVHNPRPEGIVIRSKMTDNPYLPVDYVEQAKKRYKDDLVKFDMMINGLDGIDIEGRPVFSGHWDRDQIISSNVRFNAERPLIRGWDFGYHNPACLAPNHKVLTRDLRWVPVGELVPGDKLFAFEENTPNGLGGSGNSRRWAPGEVTSTQRAIKDCLRVTLSDGTSFICSKDHRFLGRKRDTTGSRSWKTTWLLATELEIGSKIPKYFKPWEQSKTFDGGWVSGFYDGEGCFYAAETNRQFRIQVTQVRNGLLDKTTTILKSDGFETFTTHNTEMRPNQQDTDELNLLGGWSEILRFLGVYRPQRLLNNYDKALRSVEQHMQKDSEETVVSIKDVGSQEVVVLETSTHTYIADGFAHHNCVFAQETDQGGLNVLAEFRLQNVFIEEFVDAVKKYTVEHFPAAGTNGRIIRDFGDYAGTQQTDKEHTTIQRAQMRGVNILTRPNSKIESGLDVIRKLMSESYKIPSQDHLSSVNEVISRRRLRIHPRCEELIDALAYGYHYQVYKNGQESTTPKKDNKYDHIVDALRYLVINTFGLADDASSTSARKVTAKLGRTIYKDF